MLPLAECAISGLYIFDNPLVEDMDNIWLPNIDTAKLTGYAGRAVSDGVDNRRGDYNFNESGVIENGYKFVWDFGTDDANGEIAALSLTHAIAGFHGYHYNPYMAVRNSIGTGTGSRYDNYKGAGSEQLYTTDTLGYTYQFVEANDDTNEYVRITKNQVQILI